MNGWMDSAPENGCIDCSKYIYKGEDEQYCQAAHMRDFALTRWQKKPKWCPLDARKRREEWMKRKEEREREGNA